MRGDLHEFAACPLELGERLRPRALPFKLLTGFNRHSGLRCKQLEPPQLLRPKPAWTPPVERRDANQSLSGAQGQEDAGLDAGLLRRLAGPGGQPIVTAWVGDVGSHLGIGQPGKVVGREWICAWQLAMCRLLARAG